MLAIVLITLFSVVTFISLFANKRVLTVALVVMALCFLLGTMLASAGQAGFPR